MKHQYLLWFANEHLNFRLPEIQSLISLLKIKSTISVQNLSNPFWEVEFENDAVAYSLASRSVSVRSILKLWGSGDTEDMLHDSIRHYPNELMKPYLCKEKSFRMEVTTFNKTFTMKEKVEKIEMFNYLPVEGRVNLKDPDFVFHYIEDYGLDPNKAPKVPWKRYFGTWSAPHKMGCSNTFKVDVIETTCVNVNKAAEGSNYQLCDGQRSTINQLSLKTRRFIGNTSMEAQLSMLMANMARLKPGDITLDPFVGSGSLLVAAANCGSLVIGADIDFLMLHGKTRPTRKQARKKPRENENVLANLKQYGWASKYIDVIVADSSLPMWRDDLCFEAIITDPPYGLREATERIGSKRQYGVSEQHAATHIPCKIEYNLTEIYGDLLKLAADRLVMNGRLVAWMPVKIGSALKTPSHPALTLIAISQQTLSAHTARRLITWEKTKHLPHAISVVPDIFPDDFRNQQFCREETRKQKRERRRIERDLKNVNRAES